MIKWWNDLDTDVRIALVLGVVAVGLLLSLMIDMIIHRPY